MSTETTDEKAPKKDVYADSFDPRYPEFTSVVGDLPFIQPNVRTGYEREDLLAHISSSTTNPTWNCVGCCLCAMTGVGCCYLCCKMVLIDQGEYGFTLNNGRYEILTPGRHVLVSPLNSFTNQYSLGLQLIQEGPITIVRVPVGSYGFAFHNAKPEVLLPGVHVRNNAAFKFSSMQTTDQLVIQFGPIKFFTVQSGSVRCCYINGRIKIFKEGRYAVNCGTFVVGPQIDTTQESLRFEKHPVLLDGGISLLVEGLLTYQVADVEKLLLQLGSKDLVRAIQDVTKAELARVFAGLHLEQISKVSDAKAPSRDPRADEKLDLDGSDEPSALLGKGAKAGTAQHASAEGETRMWICAQVIKYITPLVASWGVRVINFQLESTKIADDNYAKEYEAASLAMAKAKASLRAVHAQNQIRLQTAQATAEAVKIEAEGKKNATIIEAQGNAEARIIEARARNEAAEMMTDPFSKEFAMAGQQVDFARNLKAQVLTVGADSGVAQIFTASAMLKNSGI